MIHEHSKRFMIHSKRLYEEFQLFELILSKQKKRQKKRLQDVLNDSEDEVNSDETDNCLETNRERPGQSQWVQCDNPECRKWRRITYIADLESLSNEKWICDMNEGVIANYNGFLIFKFILINIITN